MSTRARKERKRAGEKFVKPKKVPTMRHGDDQGLGLMSSQEFEARLLARPQQKGWDEKTAAEIIEDLQFWKKSWQEPGSGWGMP